MDKDHGELHEQHRRAPDAASEGLKFTWVFRAHEIKSFGLVKVAAFRVHGVLRPIREFPKIRGTLFWGPYDTDPTM